MNSDHAPTAEEQLPPLDVTPEDARAGSAAHRTSGYGFMETIGCRERQLLAALRENRELRKCCNLGGNPLRLDGVHVKCAADPKDEHEIYGGGMRQPDGRIFCELHAHRAMCAEKDARIAELEVLERTVKFMSDSYLEEHGNWGVCKWRVQSEAAEAKLRAVSDVLDEHERQYDHALYAHIRAIISGK